MKRKRHVHRSADSDQKVESPVWNKLYHHIPALTFRNQASYIYIGQTYRYSPENAFCIFSQQMHLMIFFFLDLLAQTPFIPRQNVMYFTVLPFFDS